MSIRGIKIFPIDDKDKFESFCLDLFKIKYKDPCIQKNGSIGQRQNGVDIFCHFKDKMEWIGIQCKVRNSQNKLQTSEIDKELELATTFNPKLSHYVIVTTCNRDTRIQEYIREINTQNRHKYTSEIIFWNDIEELLTQEEYSTVLYRYYEDFFIDALKHGYIHGRLITIRSGVGSQYDTQHEVIIGKIPIIDSEKKWDIYYFQNRYFICDLNEKTFDLFTKECFPGDFEYVIKNKFDREIITKWINSVDLDKVLFEEDMEYGYLLSIEEKKDFLERNKGE